MAVNVIFGSRLLAPAAVALGSGSRRPPGPSQMPMVARSCCSPLPPLLVMESCGVLVVIFGASKGGTMRAFILVEPSLQVIAYTRSKLHFAMLSFFLDLRALLPDAIGGAITWQSMPWHSVQNSSVQRALKRCHYGTCFRCFARVFLE